MINLQKFNRIKVKNEEEFDTVVADLAEQDVVYKGYLPISDEARADIDESFRKDFPKYLTIGFLNGGLNVSFERPSTWEERRWYVPLAEIGELDHVEHVYPVLFTEDEWVAFTDGVLNRITFIEKEIGYLEAPTGGAESDPFYVPYTEQEQSILVNRLKGNISGFKKAYEVLTTFTSNYKTTFELTMDEESPLTDELDAQMSPLYSQSKSFIGLKHDPKYSVEKLANRSAFIQGEMASLGEVRDAIRAYSQVKIDAARKEREKGKPTERKRTQVVRPDLKEEIEKMRGENDGAV